jgi:aspartate/methionine/tyrosine aminotransferase
MTVRRLQGIPGFSIDRVAAAAGDDPEVLRLENLDTDIPPPYSAREATRKDIGRDEANSYLPFTGRRDLCETIASHVNRVAGRQLYAADQVVVTSGGTEGMLDALLAVTDPGDAVVLTDPTYAGMIYRVRLAGAEPLFVPFVAGSGQWRLDLEQLQTAVTARTRALFLMNPSMPSGAVLSEEEWRVVAQLCRERDLWLIYNAAMERILFDGRQLRHPVALEGMAERTIVVGSLSKEYRMIGWRIGWVVGPRRVIVAALTEPSDAILPAIGEWQRRRDAMTAELRDYSIIPAAGGWSQLLDVARPRFVHRVGAAARAGAGRGHADARLGRSKRRQLRASRLQQ